MTKFPCPHCNNLTLSLKQKYLVAKWQDVQCDACRGLSCAQPVVLALMSFIYVWDVLYFGVVAYAEHSWAFIGMMLSIWLILDFFCHYIPLSRLKSPNKRAPVTITGEPMIPPEVVEESTQPLVQPRSKQPVETNEADVVTTKNTTKNNTKKITNSEQNSSQTLHKTKN